MNILQICKYNLKSVGGIEYVTRVIHDELRKTHKICSISFSRDNESCLKLGEISFSVNITLFKQPLSYSYIKTLYKKLRQADVVIYHHPNPIVIPFLLLNLKKSSKLKVYWHSDIINFGILGKLVRQLEKLMIKKAETLIFTSSEYCRSSYVTRYVKPEQIEIIPIGIADPNNYKKQKLKDLGRLSIIFIGRLSRYKGILEMLDSISRLDPIPKLSIIGTGDLADEVEMKVGSFGPDADIKLYKNIKDSEKYQLLSEADFLILPSLTKAEAFGVVLVEALSVGTPLITRYVEGSGMNDVNSPNSYGAVGYKYDEFDSENLVSLFEYLDKLSPTELKKLRVNARRKYLDNYTLENYMARLREVLLDGY